MVNLSVFMYGKPGWGMDEGSNANPVEIRELGNSIKEQMDVVADITERLLEYGWEITVGLYEIYAFSDKLKVGDVSQHLEEIGLDRYEDYISINEFEDYDENEDDEDLISNVSVNNPE